MRTNLSMVGRLASVLASNKARRAGVALIAGVCAVLTLYPEQHRAAMSLTPTDPGSLGLGGAAAQLGALNSVFGNQSAVEVSLRIANSPYVRGKVVEQAQLADRLGLSEVGAQRWLDDEVDVRSMRGGIIEFEMKHRDERLAYDVINAYGTAVREQLGVIARNQTAYKRQILEDLVETASTRLADAQAEYDTFRLRTRYSSPEAAISAVGDRIPALEEQIKDTELELNAARQFFTDDNLEVRQIMAQLQSLQGQLAQARSLRPTEDSSVGRVVRESTEVQQLRRNLEFARGLYDSYTRFLQGTSVEDLTSTANVRVLEPAYVDPERQYNLIPMLIGIAVLLLGLAVEFYNLRPPVRRHRED